MSLFKSLESEFRRQMDNWFIVNPEVAHQWIRDGLIINHPCDKSKKAEFEISKSKISVTIDRKRKSFRSLFFENAEMNAFKVRGYWIHELLKDEPIVRKPLLSNNEVAVIHCNRQYGQVLTTKFNIYNGWGETYLKFETTAQARDYISSIDLEHMDATIVDSEFKFIETHTIDGVQ